MWVIRRHVTGPIVHQCLWQDNASWIQSIRGRSFEKSSKRSRVYHHGDRNVLSLPLVAAIIMCTVQTSLLYLTPPIPARVRSCPAVCEQLQHENGTTTGNAENTTSTHTTLSIRFARVTLEGPDFEYQFFDLALSLVSPNARARLREMENVVDSNDIVWEDVFEGTKSMLVDPPRMHALFDVTHLLEAYVKQSRDINLTTDLYTLWWLTDAVFRETHDRVQMTRHGRTQAMAFAWAQTREVFGNMLNSHCNVVCHRQYVIDKFNIPYDSL